MRWISLVVLCSCKSPKKEDIIGTWQSDDGASFHFSNDGTFSVKNIPRLVLLGESYKEGENLVSGTGVWEIKSIENNWKIELLFSNSKEYEFRNHFGDYLDIEENFWSDSSWNLCFYGDDFNYKYIFTRSK